MLDVKITKVTKSAAVTVLKMDNILRDDNSVGYKSYSESSCKNIFQKWSDHSSLLGLEFGCLLEVRSGHIDGLGHRVVDPKEEPTINFDFVTKETLEGIDAIRKAVLVDWEQPLANLKFDFNDEQTNIKIVLGSYFNQVARDGIVTKKVNFVDGTGKFKEGKFIALRFYRIEFIKPETLTISLGTLILISNQSTEGFKIFKCTVNCIDSYLAKYQQPEPPSTYKDINDWSKDMDVWKEATRRIRVLVGEACRALDLSKCFGEAFTIKELCEKVGIDPITK